jgi:ribonuclease-3
VNLIEKIEDILGAKVKSTALYEQAFSHPSSLRRHQSSSFERLEFLGDRVLSMVIANQLYHQYKKDAEGTLAKRQAALVNKNILREIADSLAFSTLVQANKHDMRSANSSILPDTVEAFIAAIYLDFGYGEAEKFILSHWRKYLSATVAEITDPKSKLQEWVQKKYNLLPIYTVINQTGPDHAPQIHLRLDIPEHDSFEVISITRRQAERDVAAIALKKILPTGDK